MITTIAVALLGASISASTSLCIADSVHIEPVVVEVQESELEAQSVEETTPEELPTPADELEYHENTYLGAYTITYYCGGECCGGSVGADGAPLTVGYSVAMSSEIPLGTTVLIDGVGFRCVTDRGVGSGWVDVYVNSHDEALALGMTTADVWIVG